MPLTGFDAFSLLPLPPTVWRVTDWPDPLDPPPPSPSLGEVDAELDASGRWDDPAGRFRSLYCATEAAGAFGENLADFAPPVGIALEIEEYLEGDSDEEFAEDQIVPGLSRVEIEQLNWRIARAPTELEATAIDVYDIRTGVALLPSIGDLLRAFGFLGLDAFALKSTERAFTRQVAGALHEAALTEAGGLRASGIRYESRLPPSWECWALWEPLPLEVDRAEVEPVTIDHPALRAAAALLGVPLRDD